MWITDVFQCLPQLFFFCRDVAFYTSSSSFVMPVVELDGKHIGTGKPGPLTRRLRTIYIEESRKAAI